MNTMRLKYEHPTASRISQLRRDVVAIHQATGKYRKNFEDMATHHHTKIFTCMYGQTSNIVCDTMCIRYDKVILTEQNMQYYPAKFRYYYSLTNGTVKQVFVPKGTTKGDLMEIAYGTRSPRNVDSAIPYEFARKHNMNTFYYVMDYNMNGHGEIRHLDEVAASNSIYLTFEK